MKYLVAAAVIMIVSCKKSDSPPTPPAPVPPVTRAIEYFPNTPKDEWVYNLADSSDLANIKNLTVTVSIIGTYGLQLHNMQTVTGTNWMYKNSASDTADSKAVFAYNGLTYKTSEVFNFQNVNFNGNHFRYQLPDAVYKLPLTAGDSYTPTDLTDNSTNVKYIGKLNINNVNYDTAYLMLTQQTEYVGSPNGLIPEYFKIEEWFVPHVGTVKLNFNVYTDLYVEKKYGMELQSKTLY